MIVGILFCIYSFPFSCWFSFFFFISSIPILLSLFYFALVHVLSTSVTYISFPIFKWNGWCDFFVDWRFFAFPFFFFTLYKKKKLYVKWSVWLNWAMAHTVNKKRKIVKQQMFCSCCFLCDMRFRFQLFSLSVYFFIFYIFQFGMSDWHDIYTQPTNRMKKKTKWNSPTVNTIDFFYPLPSNICSDKIETKKFTRVCVFFSVAFHRTHPLTEWSCHVPVYWRMKTHTKQNREEEKKNRTTNKLKKLNQSVYL